MKNSISRTSLSFNSLHPGDSSGYSTIISTRLNPPAGQTKYIFSKSRRRDQTPTHSQPDHHHNQKFISSSSF
ncbi:hypothetical protein N665_0525s0013 [Sinapis alba]|nr:hypothetical protein N665_0525s0013 [Sinapis alba]